MKKITASITLLAAIAISVVAAVMSITGMMVLFAATATAVCVMMATLEASKLVAAQWLHSNWKNPNVNFVHRTYMIAAVGALMVITSIGIYGFLSKGHLEQEAPLAGIELQIAQKQQQLTMLTESNTTLQTKLAQLDKSIDSFITQDKATLGLRARASQRLERNSIDTEIKANNANIAKVNTELLPLKLQTSEVEAKLGPIKYVAELFGWADTNSAVRLIIMILMFAFDPLAIVLLLSAMITFKEIAVDKENSKIAMIEEINVPIMPTVTKLDTQNTDEPLLNIVDDITVVENEVNATKDHPVILGIVHDDEHTLDQVDTILDTLDITELTDEDFIIEDPKKVKYQKSLKKFVKDAYMPKVIQPEGGITSSIDFAFNEFQGDGSSDSITDKNQFIALLEKQPGLLDVMIEVISTYKKQIDEVPNITDNADVVDQNDTILIPHDEIGIYDSSVANITLDESVEPTRNSWLQKPKA